MATGVGIDPFLLAIRFIKYGPQVLTRLVIILKRGRRHSFQLTGV